MEQHSLNLTIPTSQTRQETEAALAADHPWFYDFVFSNGAGTETRADVAPIHYTRAELVFPTIDRLRPDGLTDCRVLDMACHQGWFAFQAALRGASHVDAFDIRPEHVSMAQVVSDASDIETVSIERSNLFSLSPKTTEPYDVTLMLGILYHIDNPLRALRLARAVTSDVCLIETQVARPAPELEMMWGAGRPRQGPAIAVVQAGPAHVANKKPLVLVPTLAALLMMLDGVGFASVEVLETGPHMHQQFQDQDRVVVAARVD